MLGSIRVEVWITLLTIALILLLPIMSLYIALHTSIASLAEGAVVELYKGAISPSDTYDYGNCTYWAALQRLQAGDPIPNSWGNAASWATRAQADGYVVDHSPSPGAIMQISNVDKGLGHVAYVESVNSTNGEWTISEMNVKGYDIVDVKTLSAGDAVSYNFIHDVG
jgi:surface antigen